MKIYVAAMQALRKKETQDETQFMTKIGAKTSLIHALPRLVAQVLESNRLWVGSCFVQVLPETSQLFVGLKGCNLHCRIEAKLCKVGGGKSSSTRAERVCWQCLFLSVAANHQISPITPPPYSRLPIFYLY